MRNITVFAFFLFVMWVLGFINTIGFLLDIALISLVHMFNELKSLQNTYNSTKVLLDNQTILVEQMQERLKEQEELLKYAYATGGQKPAHSAREVAQARTILKQAQAIDNGNFNNLPYTGKKRILRKLAGQLQERSLPEDTLTELALKLHLTPNAA